MNLPNAENVEPLAPNILFPPTPLGVASDSELVFNVSTWEADTESNTSVTPFEPISQDSAPLPSCQGCVEGDWTNHGPSATILQHGGS